MELMRVSLRAMALSSNAVDFRVSCIGQKCVRFFMFFSVSGDMLLETWLMRCSKFKSSNQSHAGCSVPMPWLQICLLPGCYLKCVIPIACETASNIGLTNEKCGDFGVRCQWNGDISYQISSIQELNHQTSNGPVIMTQFQILCISWNSSHF